MKANIVFGGGGKQPKNGQVFFGGISRGGRGGNGGRGGGTKVEQQIAAATVAYFCPEASGPREIRSVINVLSVREISPT